MNEPESPNLSASTSVIRVVASAIAQPLVVVLLISAAAMSCYVAFVPGSDSASIGRWNSDHYSHYNAAILFWHRGYRIYDTPVRELCGPTTAASRDFAARHGLDSDDSCELPERLGSRPLVINWSDLPRPYPPGQLLYSAPEAILYAHSTVSVRSLNVATIIKHVIVGHILVGVILAMLFGGAKTDEREVWRSLGFVVAPIVYFGIAPFSMMGFYDAFAIVLVCLAVEKLQRRAPVGALLLLSLAAFMHFRTLWYLPLGLLTLLELRREEHRGRIRTMRGIGIIVASTVLLVLSAVALIKVGPYLRQFPHTNPALLARVSVSPATINYICLLAVVCLALVWQRQWLLVVLVVWQGVMIGFTVQAQSWHAMFLLPLLPIARWQSARAPTIVAILLLTIGVTRVVFNTAPLPGTFIVQLLHGQI